MSGFLLVTFVDCARIELLFPLNRRIATVSSNVVCRYYEGGVSSVYFWDLDDGFAGVVLLKKSVFLRIEALPKESYLRLNDSYAEEQK